MIEGNHYAKASSTANVIIVLLKYDLLQLQNCNMSIALPFGPITSYIPFQLCGCNAFTALCSS